MALYILRWPLLEGFLQDRIVVAMRDALGVNVEVGPFSGSLVSSVYCESASGEAVEMRANLRAFECRGIHAEYNLWRLIRGDLAGISLRIDGASLVWDLDRPGLPRREVEEVSAAEPFSAPPSLPVLQIPLEQVVVVQAGRIWSVEGLGLVMAEPGPEGTQRGSLAVERIFLAAAEDETLLASRTRCPLVYDAGRVTIGPLESDRERDLFSAHLSLPDQTSSSMDIEIRSAPLAGSAGLTARVDLSGEMAFSARLEGHDFDLSRIPLWIARELGLDLGARGLFGMEATLKGALSNPLAITALGSLRLFEAGIDGAPPVDVTVRAGLNNATLSIEHCLIEAGLSKLVVSEVLCPLSRGIPLAEGVTGTYRLHIEACDPWLTFMAGKQEVGPLRELTADGGGAFRGYDLTLERLRLALASSDLILENGAVSWTGEGILLELEGLRGAAHDMAFELVDPLGLAWTPGDGARLEDMRFDVNPFSLRLEPREARDEFTQKEGDRAGDERPIGDHQVVEGVITVNEAWLRSGKGRMALDVTGLNSAPFASLLPKGSGSLPEPLVWHDLGLDVSLDIDLAAGLDGSLGGVAGRIGGTIARISLGDFTANELRVAASLTPAAVNLESFDFAVGESGKIHLTAGWPRLQRSPWALPDSISAGLSVTDLQVESLVALFPPLTGGAGVVEADLVISGDPSRPEVDLIAQLELSRLPADLAGKLPIDSAGLGQIDGRFEATVREGLTTIDQARLESTLGVIAVTGKLPLSPAIASQGAGLEVNPTAPLRLEAEIGGLDIGTLGLDPRLAGTSSMLLSVSGSLRDPEARLSMAVNALSYAGLDPHQVTLESVLRRDKLDLRELSVTTSGKRLVAGHASIDLAAQADADASAEGSQASEISWMEIPRLDPGSGFHADLSLTPTGLAAYAEVLGVPIEGLASFDLVAQGTLEEPRLEMSFGVDAGGLRMDSRMLAAGGGNHTSLPSQTALGGNGREGGTPGEENGTLPFNLLGRLAFRKGELILEELILSGLDPVEPERRVFEGTGRVPLGLGWPAVRDRGFVDPQAALEGHLHCEVVDLSRFKPWLPGVRRIAGSLAAEMNLEGTLAAPDYAARLRLEKGALRLESQIPSIEGLDLALLADEKGLVVERLDAKMGGGPLHLEGSVPFFDFSPQSLDLRLRGDHVLLSRGNGIKVRANLDLAVKGPIDGAAVTGRIGLVETRFVKHIPLIPGKSRPSVGEQFQPFSLTDPVGSKIRFDVAVETDGNGALRVDNNLAGGEIRMKMRLAGTGRAPYLQGDATFHDMTIKLPNFRLTTDLGRISFTEGNPYMPNLLLAAYGRRQGFDVDLVAQGPLNDLEVSMSSRPPLDDEAQLVLLTTGILPERIQDSGVGNQALRQVGSYLGQELLHELFGSETTESGGSLADRFELNIGSEVGTDGTDNIILEYSWQDPWYLQIERDIYSDVNLGVVYRIRFK